MRPQPLQPMLATPPQRVVLEVVQVVAPAVSGPVLVLERPLLHLPLANQQGLVAVQTWRPTMQYLSVS